MEQRQGPSAAFEFAAGVLIRPAESLHHSVDRDMRDCRQLHDRGSTFPGAPRGRPLTPCYEHLCLDPTPPRGFLSRIFWFAGCKRSDGRDGFGATALHFLMCASSADLLASRRTAPLS